MNRTMSQTIALILGVAVLGIAGAQDCAADPDENGRRGIYLSYVNAPAESQNIIHVPKLMISFGATPFEIVMDTGSTGILVSARQIPNIDSLPSLGPGKLT